MEYKKQLLIKVLKRLEPYRDMATGILALVESSYIDEKTIDGVLHLLAQSIKNIKIDENKARLQRGLEKIQQIKILEDEEKISGENVDDLLADI